MTTITQENTLATCECSITGEIMIDPVSTKNGQTYERSAIEEWFKRSDTDPNTGSTLSDKTLRPNYAIKSLCEQLRSSMKSSSSSEKKESDSKISFTPPNTRVSYTKINSSDTHTTMNALVTIKSPEANDQGTHHTIMIDTSGSMNDKVTGRNDSGEKTDDGCTILDITKHAVLTFIAGLKENDTCSIFSFSSEARLCLDTRKMDLGGKGLAKVQISVLSPSGMTNIHDALTKGLQKLSTLLDDKKKCMILFTDGEPTVRPPSVNQHSDKDESTYFQKNIQKLCVEKSMQVPNIYVFGFGKRLDATLLQNIASKTPDGHFNYIPDSGFTGTCIMNAMASSKLTSGLNGSLIIDKSDDITIEKVFGNYILVGNEIKFGNLQEDQERNFIISFKIPNEKVSQIPNKLNISLNYIAPQLGPVRIDTVVKEINLTDYNYHSLRLEAIELIQYIWNQYMNRDFNSVEQILKGFIEMNTKKFNNSDVRATGLLADLSGQVTEAISRQDWFSTWGQYYLPSLAGAHKRELPNNFKDIGLQHYKNKKFNQIIEELEDIFLTKISPPKPSRVVYSSSSNGRSQPTPVRTQNYYQSAGPCFHGDCIVDYTRVSELLPGHKLDEKTTIKYIIKTKTNGCQRFICLPDGLMITPWHPIKFKDQWIFPQKIYEANTFEITEKILQCDYVYNFVLETTREHSMMVNGYRCITLGHGINDNEVTRHDYFGTQRVVKDLSQMNGADTGIIELRNGCLQRAPEYDSNDHQRVVGMLQ